MVSQGVYRLSGQDSINGEKVNVETGSAIAASAAVEAVLSSCNWRDTHGRHIIQIFGDAHRARKTYSNTNVALRGINSGIYFNAVNGCKVL